MNTRILIPVAWTLRDIMVVVMLYGLVRVYNDRVGPDSWRGLAVAAVVFILLLLAGAGVFLNIAAQKQWTKGIITMAVIFAWPLVSLIANPAMLAFKTRRFAAAEASVGDFRDATLAAMARDHRERFRDANAAARQQASTRREGSCGEHAARVCGVRRAWSERPGGSNARAARAWRRP